jgi:Predicted transcriptional regulators
MFSEQVYDVLTELGLSPLQAKVYSALIQLQDPTATAASKLSKVARQEVYRITEELEATGLVHRTISTPVRFQAVPLPEALSTLMARRINTTSGLMKKIKEVNREAKKKQEKIVSSYIIKELSPNENWFGITPLKFKSSKSFDLMTSFDRLATRFNADTEAFKKAAMTKRTLIRIITDKPPTDSLFWELFNSLSTYPYFQMRFLDRKPDAVIVIFNKKEAALSISLDKPPGPPYLYANHPAFLYLAQEHFESVWRRAKPLTVQTCVINRN